MISIRFPLAACAAAALSCLLCACTFDLFENKPKTPPPAPPPRLQYLRFTDPIRPVVADPPIVLHAARNETVSFAIQINGLGETKKDDLIWWEKPQPPLLRLATPQIAGTNTTLPAMSVTAYQLLAMPVETNRAGFVRQAGAAVAEQSMPRALLPLALDKGVINLDRVRNPAAPSEMRSASKKPTPSPMIWVDLQVPPMAAPGEYQGACELLENGKVMASLPIRIIVADFVIPDERHLLMVGQVEWTSLERLYPDQFRGIQPHLFSRRDARYAAAVKTLDELVKLAHDHRLQLAIPRLQPTVKWPSGRPPLVDWADFDSLVTPWLKGDAFSDNLPLGYWPIPRPDYLDRYAEASQLEYWQAAAAHFDELDWLARSSVSVPRSSAGRVQMAESVDVSQRAARVLGVHPKVRVSVPLEEEQVQVATDRNPGWIRAQDLDRLMYAAAGLVSVPPVQRLPANNAVRWLRTDVPGLVPYIGAGADEREVRLWSWLAYLRNATLVQWPDVLPQQANPAAPSEVDEMSWFYPGAWFGVEGPVPTVQLKWLRRAQQDFEYLWLARQRGQRERSMTLARLVVKPVELQPAQTPEAAYALMSGTGEAKAWDEVLGLVSRTVQLSPPGQSVDPQVERQLTFDIAAWAQSHERPLLMARSADWSLGVRDAQGIQWLNLRLGIDIYNAADRQPDRNSMSWTSVPESWVVRGEMTNVPRLGAYSVNRYAIESRINLDRITPAARKPAKIAFQDGYTGRPSSLDILAPVAWCERREESPPNCDGSLADWSQADALHEGKLVEMLTRSAIHRQELVPAATNSAVYSTWTPGNLYLAFRVEGATAPTTLTQTNFVNYDFRRAWGEDICEVLVQPIYTDGSTGPLLYVACKPRGQLDTWRRLDPKLHANPWQPFPGAAVRYAATVEAGIWRGEVAIPWDAINATAAAGRRPALLRFNFVQHRGATGQSASWAGPVDFGRDDAFMGLLQVRQ